MKGETSPFLFSTFIKDIVVCPLALKTARRKNRIIENNLCAAPKSQNRKAISFHSMLWYANNLCSNPFPEIAQSASKGAKGNMASYTLLIRKMS